MGKVAGAVLTAAAPEAKAASRVAGRRPPASDPRATAPGSKAAKQRADIEAIKASRTPDPPAPEVDGPPPTPPGGGPSLPTMPAPMQTGSGFLLGVFAWALGLAYLQGGMPGVRKFAAAKFFNKT